MCRPGIVLNSYRSSELFLCLFQLFTHFKLLHSHLLHRKNRERSTNNRNCSVHHVRGDAIPTAIVRAFPRILNLISISIFNLTNRAFYNFIMDSNLSLVFTRLSFPSSRSGLLTGSCSMNLSIPNPKSGSNGTIRLCQVHLLSLFSLFIYSITGSKQRKLHLIACQIFAWAPIETKTIIDAVRLFFALSFSFFLHQAILFFALSSDTVRPYLTRTRFQGEVTGSYTQLPAVENFTIFLKSNIYFPNFGVSFSSTDEPTYNIETCNWDPVLSPDCPIIRIADILSAVGTTISTVSTVNNVNSRYSVRTFTSKLRAYLHRHYQCSCDRSYHRSFHPICLRSGRERKVNSLHSLPLQFHLSMMVDLFPRYYY